MKPIQGYVLLDGAGERFQAFQESELFQLLLHHESCLERLTEGIVEFRMRCLCSKKKNGENQLRWYYEMTTVEGTLPGPIGVLTALQERLRQLDIATGEDP